MMAAGYAAGYGVAYEQVHEETIIILQDRIYQISREWSMQRVYLEPS